MIGPPKPYPCASCPYRRDVPSGVWAEEEYEKLPRYDGGTGYQPPGVFLCHQADERICSGWAGCHDGEHLLALRLAVMTAALTPEDRDAAVDYVSPVPLFGSGAEAAEHGLREGRRPGDAARRLAQKIMSRRRRRG